MTTKQLQDEILTEMAPHLSHDQMGILNDVLIKILREVTVERNTELITIEDLNENYLKMYTTLKLSKLSKQTGRSYAFTIKKFLTCVGNKPLNKVNSVDIEYFLQQLRKTNSETSINNHKRNLSAFFAWMLKKQFIPFNPVDDVDDYKEVRKLIDHLEPEEFEALKDGCKFPRDRALLEFLRCTAVRVGEIVPLKINSVNFSTGEIIVYGEKTREYRTVYLDKIALIYLKEYINSRGLNESSDAPLFVKVRAPYPVLNISGIENALDGIQRRSKLQRSIYPHLFRKTCATMIVRRGGSVQDAGLYLGHKDQGVTAQFYTYRGKDYVRQIFEKYVQSI